MSSIYNVWWNMFCGICVFASCVLFPIGGKVLAGAYSIDATYIVYMRNLLVVLEPPRFEPHDVYQLSIIQLFWGRMRLVARCLCKIAFQVGLPPFDWNWLEVAPTDVIDLAGPTHCILEAFRYFVSVGNYIVSNVALFSIPFVFVVLGFSTHPFFGIAWVKHWIETGA